MRRILFIILLNSIFYFTYSQTESFKTNVSVTGLWSLKGFKIYDFAATPVGIIPFWYPGTQINAERRFGEKIGLGVAFSMQRMGLNYIDWSFINEDNRWDVGDFTTTLDRYNIGIKLLYHYNSEEYMTFYSGVRVGYSFWRYATNQVDPRYKISSIDYGRDESYSMQIIVMGFQYYIYKQVGFTGELALGNPFFLSAGLVCRF